MPIQSKRAPRGPVKSPFSSKKRHLVESLVAAQLLICSLIATPSQAGQLAVSAFTPYNASAAASIVAGPFALYTVKLNSVMPTQMDEGLAEVAKKTAGFNLETSAQMQATMQTYVEPVVIGPGGVLYLTDGHHTFTALSNSIWGASNPTVYVNVIANYSNLSTAQFYAQMQSVNLLLPLNDGVPQPVNGATGSPIPTSLTSMASDVYRGLEYSILKNKSSKLFSTSSNLTGAVGASTPGLDKMTGAYVDFVEAQAYRDANGGLGLPYLSPADIALATQWNLNGTSTSTLPGVATTLTAAQLPGFILSGNISNAGGISNNTLTTGALDGNGGFTGQDYVNLGTSAHPIWIGTPNVGFVMELGNDTGKSVTLNGTNTYTGGTTITAGNLIVASDAALGAPAPASYTINPNSLLASVQAANGIVFNSLTEGNGTLTLNSSFSTNRPIAVDGEVATINLNGNTLNLTGPIVSLGTAGVGIGNATGVSDLTFDDLSAAGNLGKVVLSTPSPLFYGNLIIGNAGVPTVEVMSDAAMGNTTGAAASIGAVELNGGTLQTGASFAAPERNLFLGGGSNIDVDGNTTSWGTLTDVQRTLVILNSNASVAGNISFAALDISSTATLQLAGGTAGESVTLGSAASGNVPAVVGIQRSGNDTLIINPSSSTSLGSTEKVFDNAITLVNGMAPAWMVTNNGVAKGAGPYDFLGSGANGLVNVAYTNTLSSGNASNVVELTGNLSASTPLAAYALNTNGKTLTLNGNTLTLGDGSSATGLIMANGSNISSGNLAFGGSEGIVWLSGASTIGAAISGSNGLTFAGSGNVTIGAAANVSGPITIDSGTVILGASNVFSSDVKGILMDNTKSKPAAAGLTISANNTLTTLNTVGNNSAITIGSGAILTLGDTTNNLSSTIAATVTESGSTAVQGALTLNGSGLFDFSGGSKVALKLVSGSSILVNNTAQLRIAGSELNTGVSVNLAGNGSALELSENGGDVLANTITGNGSLHLMGGTLQITGTSNTYSGGTFVEAGSTLDITTNNLPSANPNIVNAGGLVVFDQQTTGNYSGVISNGVALQGLPGAGNVPLAGSLVKDDSSGNNTGNLILAQQQTYSGTTSVEAGTLTLGAVNTIANSAGVTLGRVGGCVGTCSGNAPAASLVLLANNTIQGLASNPGSNVAVLLGNNTLTIDPSASATNTAVTTNQGATNTVFTYGGSISGNGSVVIGGNGVQAFTGNNSYSGGTQVNTGATLSVNAGAALGTGAVALVGSGNTPATLSVTGTTTLGNAITLAGTGAINAAAGTTTTVGGSIGNGTSAGSLLVNGAGLVTLTSASSYTGLTTINAGSSLALSGNGAIASTSGVVDNGTFNIAGANTAAMTLAALSGNGVINLGSNQLTVGSDTFSGTIVGTGNVNAATLSGSGNLNLGNNGLNVGSGNTSTTYGGNLSGNGPLQITAGNLTLSGNNSGYAGSITVDAGAALTITSGSALGSGTVFLQGSGNTPAVIDFSQSTTVTAPIVVSNDPVFVVAQGTTTTISSVISGAGDVVVNGGGVLDLSNTNTYTGNTSVAGAGVNAATTLALVGSGSIAASSSVAVGGVLDISQTTAGASLGNLTGAGLVALGSQTLRLQGTNNFSGVIADGGIGGGTLGSLSIVTGTTTLTGANTYTGSTAIASGATLALGGSGSIASSTSVLDNGTLDISATNSGATVQNLSGSGNVALGTKMLSLTGASTTFTGNMTGSGGVTVGAGVTLAPSGSLAGVNVTNNGTFNATSASGNLGSYTQTSGGAVLAVNGQGQALQVNGVAVLSAGAIELTAPLSTYGIGHYELVYAAGGVTATTSALTLENTLAPLGYAFNTSVPNELILNVTPNNVTTLNAVNQVASGISAVNNLAFAALDGSLGNDCSNFGAQGICLSVGAGFSTQSGGSATDTSLVLGYRMSPNWRASVFADQPQSGFAVYNVTQSSSRPLMGFTLGWNERADGSGYGIQMGAAWNASSLQIARMAASYAEAASGSTNSRGNAYQVKASTSYALGDRVTVNPYVGVRYAEIDLDAYTETGAIYPLSYNAVTQRTVDALAGAGLSYQFTPLLSAYVALSATANLSNQGGSVSGTSNIVGMQNYSVALPANGGGTLGMGAGMSVDLGHKQSLGLSAALQQPSLAQISVSSVSLSYSVGF